MNKSKFFHKRKGSLLFELCIYCIFIGILFAVVSPSSGTRVRSMSDDIMKDQCLVIDNALGIWYSSHSAQYPNDLTTLKDMDFISFAIDLDQFTYSSNNDKSEYRLTTELKSGITYKSAGSKY